MTPEKRLKSVCNWIAGADYDLETAKHMLKTKRYIYVVFMCHLSLEKMIKAHVELKEDKFPPKIHDLVKLSIRAKLDIPDDLNDVIVDLNKESIPTRYPEDLQRSLAQYTQKYCSTLVRQTEATLQWLKNHQHFSAL